MEKKQSVIKMNTRVIVNTPMATGIHGKTGTVTSHREDNHGTYWVLVDGLNHPSFLYREEIEEVDPDLTDKLLTALQNRIDEINSENASYRLKLEAGEKNLEQLKGALDIMTKTR